MIDGFMTVAGNQHRVARPDGRTDGGQNPAGAAVDQKPGLFAAPKTFRMQFDLPQNPLRVMEVVETVDLGDVAAPGEAAAHRFSAAFVAGHVHGVIIRMAVFLQHRPEVPLCVRLLLHTAALPFVPARCFMMPRARPGRD